MNINTDILGGCFWCMTKPFDQFDGIETVTSGYMGGSTHNPTYEDVKSGTTGHYETVKIEYDVALFSYNKLLEVFFSVIDPIDDGGQFQDRGSQYRTLYSTRMRIKKTCEQYVHQLEQTIHSEKAIATKILPASTFTKQKNIIKIFTKEP